MKSSVPDDEIRERWERRAAEQGSNETSVLFKKLPKELNKQIHKYHSCILNERFLPLVVNRSNLLDLGCGFGRISQIINVNRPDISITGLDFSMNFCRLYQDSVRRPVVCADLSKAPFLAQSFNTIISITSLMYLPASDRAKVMCSLIQLLKPGGVALFLDPGQEYMDLVARLHPVSRENSTGGNGFYARDYLSLARSAGVTVIATGGMLFFSLLLPVMLLLRHSPRSLNMLIGSASWLDRRLNWFGGLSLHRWMILKVPGQADR
ncbi:MAG: class I SAM-dependent methyltransferase [Gammaproteobacteria bacterium]|nr:class I SAM-dependent methyltransferase [Gammaproteobacteria bacterium]